MTVLILTQQMDFHADPVVARLNDEGIPVVRIDTSDFPLDLTLDCTLSTNGWRTRFRTSKRVVSLDELSSIWYRRPTRFKLDPSIDGAEKRFAESEARAGVGGALRMADCLWVNHPEKLISANYKPMQLKLAAAVGLAIPRSVITNDPEVVRAFLDDCRGNVCYKPLGGGDVGPLSTIFTSIVTDTYRDELDRVRQTACLFQEYVSKQIELRITIIGEDIFCAGIYSQDSEETRVDWRRSQSSLRFCRYSLPEDVASKCLKLTKLLGLAFSAIDMIVTPQGDLVFLELNPNGQWLWLEDIIDLPMTDSMVSLLSRGKVQH